MEFYNELIDDKLKLAKPRREILWSSARLEDSWRNKSLQDNGPTYFPAQYHFQSEKVSAIVLGSPIWPSLLAAFLADCFRAVLNPMGGGVRHLVLRLWCLCVAELAE